MVKIKVIMLWVKILYVASVVFVQNKVILFVDQNTPNLTYARGQKSKSKPLKSKYFTQDLSIIYFHDI